MTPSARIAAASEILDAVFSGQPAEEALIRWARRSRFAGSGDRHAVRDLVFEAIRCRRSFAAWGGIESGRGLMIGRLRSLGEEPDAYFTGEGHAPAPLSVDEKSAGDLPEAGPDNVRLDIPDWIADDLQRSLGEAYEPVALALRKRAPVGLRVNTLKADHDSAEEALLADGIESTVHPLARTARIVTSNPRRVARSRAYLEGLVEFQDPASQAVIEAVLPLAPQARVLDFCAGGGGKALALAAAGGRVSAHDANAGRMDDIPERAARAGADIHIIPPGQVSGHWNLVVVDAPCSGSGSWRRQPDAKWRLSPESLRALTKTQEEILDQAAKRVSPDGMLAYVTCSLLDLENRLQADAFLKRNPDAWIRTGERQFLPTEGGDGFYMAKFSRKR